MFNEFFVRVGTFLILVGIAVMAYFAITVSSHQPDFRFFFLSILSIFIGWHLSRRKAPPPPSERFKTLRKWREGSKKKEEGKRE